VSRPTAQPRRRPSRRTAALIAAASVIVVIAIVIALWPRDSQSSGAPAPGTVIVASSLSKAQTATTESTVGTSAQRAAEYLSEQPTAYWLTPEADPLDRVAATVAHLADEAREQSARLAVVVYGLPGRDCGNHSAGGLAPAAYAEWTQTIGDALRDAADVAPIVILEPDSLALAPECDNVSERVVQLGGAVEALASDTTWLYLDAGHSNWLSVAEMARLIDQVGHRDDVRGFATNVSNYNSTKDEIAYAHDLAERLDGMHAIIDTSRNGAGSDGEWCNPEGRLIGEPGGTIGDDVIDTNLWIKPPGESDGTCNGGPAAGHWWPEGAIELTRRAVSE
jgi:Cellobiohydrolase A (1,4-beta-cellobiosidase A)